MGNFEFLKNKWEELAKLGELAEQYLYSDTNTCFLKMGLLAEHIVEYMLAYDGIPQPEYDNTHANRINLLRRNDLLPREIDNILYVLRKTRNDAAHNGMESFDKAKDNLEKNIPLRLIEFSEEEMNVLNSFAFLTIKPMIYLANVSEDDVAKEDNDYVKKVKECASKENSKVIKMCAKLESELSELNDDDKKEMLNAVGIEESGLDKLIKETYDLLGLATYFTVGSDEVRAWTFKKGMNAKKCAGIIHTDFEKGFIKAEVMSYDDLIKYGSEQKVKEAGRARLEGKDYIMQDGDICYFRFNV